jgi:hypothetical protein
MQKSPAMSRPQDVAVENKWGKAKMEVILSSNRVDFSRPQASDLSNCHQKCRENKE